MRSIHRLAGAGALALASSLAFAVNAEAAASLVRPGAPGHGHMDHMAHGFAPGREDHRRFLEPRVIGGFYAGAAYGAALGAAAPYDYASPDYGYSTGYDTTEAAPATGGYAAPAYSNAPQAYSYAPQTYSHSYSVPTVVYQTVTRDYTIPVQTYRTVQRTRYVPVTSYQAVTTEEQVPVTTYETRRRSFQVPVTVYRQVRKVCSCSYAQ